MKVEAQQYSNAACDGVQRQRLQEVLQRLRKANLKLSPKKCSLLQHEAPFLGHVASQDGVRKDPQKVAVVEKWPVLRVWLKSGVTWATARITDGSCRTSPV